MMIQNLIRTMAATMLLIQGGCSGNEPAPAPGDEESRFESADFGNNAGYYRGIPGAAPEKDAIVGEADGAPEAADPRTVEEGDIYRVLSDNLLLNFNSFRGLQVIDISEVRQPEIIGRLGVSATPVEMYVVGDFAYLLLNHWQTYYGRDGLQVEPWQGGLVLVVDLSDPRNPVEVARAQVEGNISTSRLTRGGGGQALYVASSRWDMEALTEIQSFSLSATGGLTSKGRLELGGSVGHVQATTEALLVSHNDWTTRAQSSTVTVVDITDPDGALGKSLDVRIAGRIARKAGMDLRDGILRLVSNSPGSPSLNHLETFDLRSGEARRVSHATFGEGDSLFASLFMDDRAFFVTYRRVDPFHVFAIDSEGKTIEKTEYIISGWNDFFRPVFADSRLIGIGKNDENGQTMAVSLYDTSLENKRPFISRAEVAISNSWSEASWDDRAFSVLEDAVSIQAKDGSIETGMILLPFNGYDRTSGRHTSAVQIFTFSANTLTRRGVMVTDNRVRRSFLADEDTPANLSDRDLSLFSSANPDEPELLGEVNLAPDHTDLQFYGDHPVRVVRNTPDHSGTQLTTLEILAPGDDPADGAARTELTLPANNGVYQVGPLAVAVDRYHRPENESGGTSTRITVVDLQNPETPRLAGKASSDAVGGYFGGGAWLEYDFMPYYQVSQVYVVGRSLVFSLLTNERMSLGQTTNCPEAKTAVPQECYHWEQFRHWNRYRFVVLDLTDPDRPLFSDPIEMPRNEEAAGLHVEGQQLYVNYKVPVLEKKDEQERSLVRYYFKTIDLSNPRTPRISQAINIPGVVIGATSDGRTLYTRDLIWGEGQSTRTTLNRLEVAGGLAFRKSSLAFLNRRVDKVILDGKGHAFVSHGENVIYYPGPGPVPEPLPVAVDVADARVGIAPPMTAGTTLSIVAVGGEMRILSEFETDSWSTLEEITRDRALFTVPGGLLMVNTADLYSPVPDAFFPLRGWSHNLVIHADTVWIPSGLYGIYRAGL